jgi:hypothetical protein
MSDDAISIPNAKTNYKLLCNVEIVMGLTCMLPMLEAIYSLNKLVSNKDTFIRDFIVAIVKMCEVELYTMYVDVEV